ncbi:hypothetical protein HOB95_02900, partial [bacterium]|nr:hypothetical protein [bacterium]
LNIIVQLDTNRYGRGKETQRYKIQHHSRELLFSPEQAMDSGDPDTLVDFCDWSIKRFPAQHYAVIMWNHGTGAIDPMIARAINPSHLFTYNKQRDLIELDRSISFMDFVESSAAPDKNVVLDAKPQTRGICFDQSTGNYIDNKGLGYALATIQEKCLNNEKLDILSFDACLMSMAEIGSIASKHAKYMVASQEVELGTGFNYARVLLPLAQAETTPEELAKHMVYAYEQSYGKITNDYTLAALDLEHFGELEDNISSVAMLLIEAIDNQSSKSVRKMITYCKSPRHCTCFDEPTYIDLYDFYQNLEKRLHTIRLHDITLQKTIVAELTKQLKAGKELILKIVTANVAGHNLRRARGISIYLPSRLHPSYRKNEPAIEMNWLKMIMTYILSR